MKPPFDINDFAHRFSCHLFDEALLHTEQEQLDVEAKLQRFLVAEFENVSSKKITLRRKGTVWHLNQK
jgi:hypothetical protein